MSAPFALLSRRSRFRRARTRAAPPPAVLLLLLDRKRRDVVDPAPEDDLLARGLYWLTSQLQSHAAQPVVYRRGANDVTVLATFGRKLLKLDDGLGGVRMEWTDADFLVPADQLVVLRRRVLPERGDRVIVRRDGRTRVYEVLAPGGEPPWTWSDPYRRMLRIHGKLVSEK